MVSGHIWILKGMFSTRSFMICRRIFLYIYIYIYIITPPDLCFGANHHHWLTALASDNLNEDKPVPFVVKQPGSSFNLKMHLGHGRGRCLKPSPSYGASQRVRRVRCRDGRWAGERKVVALVGLDLLSNLFLNWCLLLIV